MNNNIDKSDETSLKISYKITSTNQTKVEQGQQVDACSDTKPQVEYTRGGEIGHRFPFSGFPVDLFHSRFPGKFCE